MARFPHLTHAVFVHIKYTSNMASQQWRHRFSCILHADAWKFISDLISRKWLNYRCWVLSVPLLSRTATSPIDTPSARLPGRYNPLSCSLQFLSANIRSFLRSNNTIVKPTTLCTQHKISEHTQHKFKETRLKIRMFSGFELILPAAVFWVLLLKKKCTFPRISELKQRRNSAELCRHTVAGSLPKSQQHFGEIWTNSLGRNCASSPVS